MGGWFDLFGSPERVILNNLSTPRAMEGGKSYSQLRRELVETSVMGEFMLSEGLDCLMDYGIIDRIVAVGLVEGVRMMHHHFKIDTEHFKPIPQGLQNRCDIELRELRPMYFRE